ncbi:MAG: hypothetical protein P9X26_06470 [Candidatus Stygibacter frigidus]|nr:hypothetical protein [Candidatus Stygibacter frigidus]
MKVEMQLTGQDKRRNVLINSSGRWITCLFSLWELRASARRFSLSGSEKNPGVECRIEEQELPVPRK